ncbi:hypothetical protein AGMMS49975_26540 [Clostridia bacterium]|nr:hypothetical protein AGMMS49975_26540 [Clostridia bacterium]
MLSASAADLGGAVLNKTESELIIGLFVIGVMLLVGIIVVLKFVDKSQSRQAEREKDLTETLSENTKVLSSLKSLMETCNSTISIFTTEITRNTIDFVGLAKEIKAEINALKESINKVDAKITRLHARLDDIGLKKGEKV